MFRRIIWQALVGVWCELAEERRAERLARAADREAKAACLKAPK